MLIDCAVWGALSPPTGREAQLPADERRQKRTVLESVLALLLLLLLKIGVFERKGRKQFQELVPGTVSRASVAEGQTLF